MKELSLNNPVNHGPGRNLSKICVDISPIVYKMTGQSLVDIDTTPQGWIPKGKKVRDLKVAEEELRKLEGRFESSTADGVFLEAQRSSVLALSQALRTGQLPSRELISRIAGFTPETIPQELMHDRRERLIRLVESSGFYYMTEGWPEFVARNPLKPQEIPQALREVKTRLGQPLTRALDLGYVPRFNFEERKEEAPWIFWTLGGRKGVTFLYNPHKSNSYRIHQGVEDMGFIHEGTHYEGILMLTRGIDEKQINPAMGLVLVPGVAQFGFEGVAMMISRMVRPLGDRLTMAGTLTIEKEVLSRWALHNVALSMMESGAKTPSQEQIRDILYYDPSQNEDTLRRSLRFRTQNLVQSAYLAAYAEGSRYLAEVTGQLSNGESVSFVRELVGTPMIPTQIRERGAEYITEQQRKLGLQPGGGLIPNLF